MGAVEEADLQFEELIKTLTQAANNDTYVSSVKRHQALHWARTGRWQQAAPVFIDYFQSLDSPAGLFNRYNWALRLERMFDEHNDDRVSMFKPYATTALDGFFDRSRWLLVERVGGNTTMLPSSQNGDLVIKKEGEAVINLRQFISATELSNRSLVWSFDFYLEGKIFLSPGWYLGYWTHER